MIVSWDLDFSPTDPRQFKRLDFIVNWALDIQ